MSGPTGVPAAGGLPGGEPCRKEFFARPSDVVGRELIGKILWRRGVGGGRLTEVEAYLPGRDPASHAALGPTRRNASMFGPAGHIYIFRSYGIHICVNIVCDQKSVGSAVLIRSFEPLGDTGCLRENRSHGSGRTGGASPTRSTLSPEGILLSCGPGRVGQALGLHIGMDGMRLGEESGLFVIHDGSRPEVGCTTRVGISRGDELLLRYYMKGSVYVTEAGQISRGGRR